MFFCRNCEGWMSLQHSIWTSCVGSERLFDWAFNSDYMFNRFHITYPHDFPRIIRRFIATQLLCSLLCLHARLQMTPCNRSASPKSCRLQRRCRAPTIRLLSEVNAQRQAPLPLDLTLRLTRRRVHQTVLISAHCCYRIRLLVPRFLCIY